MFQFLGPVANGQTSVILRGTILDSSATTYAGLTNTLFSATGLVIATICDNEATTTAYTSGGSTTETIATLGTYVAPTSTKCRFKKVDDTNHPGLYELQLADARFAVAGAKWLDICISGVTNMAQTRWRVPLVVSNPYSLAQNGVMNTTTIATLTSQTAFTLTAGSTADSAYAGCMLVFQDATTAATRGSAIVSTYTGSTKGVVLTAAPPGITLAVGTLVTVITKQAVSLAGQTLSFNGPTLGPGTGSIAFSG